MASERSIAGKTFVITGGATGLGAAFAEAFLKDGAKHIAILDVAEERGRATEAHLNELFGAGAARFQHCDVADERQLSEAYSAVLAHCGTIDVVINNAGIFHEGKPREMIDINIAGLVMSSYKAFDCMRKDRGGAGGTVVNVASVAALGVTHLMPVYCATKSAVVTFSASLGIPARFNSTGVRVLAICFGSTDTDILKNIDARQYDEETARDAHLILKMSPMQEVEPAVQGMLDMFRRGDSGSIWLAEGGRPARDITGEFKEGQYNILKKNLSQEGGE